MHPVRYLLFQEFSPKQLFQLLFRLRLYNFELNSKELEFHSVNAAFRLINRNSHNRRVNFTRVFVAAAHVTPFKAEDLGKLTTIILLVATKMWLLANSSAEH